MDTVKAFALAHWWIGAAVIIVGAVLRALHDDTAVPASLPKRWLPLVGLGLGVLLGVVAHGALGVRWVLALAGGALAAVLAMAGYDVVFKSILGGWLPPMGSPSWWKKTP